MRQPTVGFPAATSRLYTAGSTQHDRPAGLGPPGYQPCSPNHPSTPHSPTAAVAALSLVDLDLCVSPSLSSLRHRQCEPCSCHISMGCEHMQARAGVGRRNVRRGGCVRKHAKSGRISATPKQGRAGGDVALAPGDSDGRASSYPARQRVEVSTCTSPQAGGQGGARS